MKCYRQLDVFRIFFFKVWIAAMGRIDVKGLMHSIRKKDYMRSCFRLFECDLADFQKKTNGKQMLKGSIIFDLEHLTMRKITDRTGIQ